MTENTEQRQLIQWCRAHPEFQFLFHIPNESVGGPGWIARNRQLGVKKGVPDLFYPVPAGGYHGLFIEMKAEKGRVSAEQERWIDALNRFGYKAVVCYGWEAARDALTEYMQESNVIANEEVAKALGDLVNGWFKRWRDRRIADSDWEQVADELNAVYTKHPYILIRDIGISLIRELERRNFGK